MLVLRHLRRGLAKVSSPSQRRHRRRCPWRIAGKEFSQSALVQLSSAHDLSAMNALTDEKCVDAERCGASDVGAHRVADGKYAVFTHSANA